MILHKSERISMAFNTNLHGSAPRGCSNILVGKSFPTADAPYSKSTYYLYDTALGAVNARMTTHYEPSNPKEDPKILYQECVVTLNSREDAEEIAGRILSKGYKDYTCLVKKEGVTATLEFSKTNPPEPFKDIENIIACIDSIAYGPIDQPKLVKKDTIPAGGTHARKHEPAQKPLSKSLIDHAQKSSHHPSGNNLS